MMDHFVDLQTNFLVRFGGKCFVPGTSLFGCFVLSAGREVVYLGPSVNSELAAVTLAGREELCFGSSVD